jgi:hypothetical protein
MIPPTFSSLQISNSQYACTDGTLKMLANIEGTKFVFLDMSYNKLMTDEGFNAFAGKKFPLHTLQVSSMGDLVTGKGLAHLIDTC